MGEPKNSRPAGVRLSATLALVLSASGCGSMSALRRAGEPVEGARHFAPIEQVDPGADGEAWSGGEPEAVTIYGVEWCGPCHQAAAFLSRRGVHYVERNIEGDEDAQREMKAKLDRAGLHAGSIPIIDIKGMILVGFSPQEMDRALKVR